MRLSRFGCLALGLCLYTGVAAAGSFSFTGSFVEDDNLQIFLFTAPGAGAVVRTWSYAGGTNAAGQLIPRGGFDPILTVFDATGGFSAASALVDSNNDGAGVATDGTTGNAFDSLLTLLAGGSYALVLSQSDNIALGPTFGDGFSQSGQGNFTAGEFGCGGSNPFCDSSTSQRNGHWAVDILNVSSASIPGSTAAPEPSSMWLLGTAIVSLTLLRRRTMQAVKIRISK
jgi:PEP-CTERM motif